MHATRDAATASEAKAAAPQPAHAIPTGAALPSNVSNTSAAATSPTPSSSSTAASTKAAAPPTVEQLIQDTESSDASKRAAAIAALANAPKVQALPALKRVLDTGEPEVDRHIALRSLHALALRDGDSNGAVRDVMRYAIYHGDNDGVTQTAQSLLDDVEAALAESQQN